MKIALCSSCVPFVNGGYRNIVDWLGYKLQEAGHLAEIIYIPASDNPDILLQQIPSFRWINLDSADRIICFRPPSYVIPHPHKILWFIHHFRIFYDLWENPVYRQIPDNSYYRSIKNTLHTVDTLCIQEAQKVFTNSHIIKKRLKKYNNIESEVLYPPILNSEKFICEGYNDEVVYICRMEHHKRQHLLLEAMKYTKTKVKLRLSGTGSPDYIQSLENTIKKWNLTQKVTLENRWISEEEKIARFAHCLAAAYLPLDEDSYGYPSLEASHASKALLTTTDAGGVLELVSHGMNGYITNPAPQALAEAMDAFYSERVKTERMGKNAKESLSGLNISWEYVLSRLLG